VRAVLRRVVDLIAQSELLEERAREIGNQLSSPLPADQLPIVLSDIADLMSRRVTAIEVEKRDIEGLLAQVTGRLAELSQFMGAENADRKAALEGTREFNTRIVANMNDLGEHVADANDLQ